MLKYFFIICVFSPLLLAAQSSRQNFIYLDRISASDLRGKNIVEFIPANFLTSVINPEGNEVSSDRNNGYLVTLKTISGKDLGINGIIIENKEDKTGELTYYQLGIKDGLKFERITQNSIYLKGPSFIGGNKAYDLYITCNIK